MEEIIMKEFDITLTATSKKNFRLSADSRDEALDLVDSLMDHSSLLDFSHRLTNSLSGWK